MAKKKEKDGYFRCNECDQNLLGWEGELFVGAQKLIVVCPKCKQQKWFGFHGNGTLDGPTSFAGAGQMSDEESA